MAARPLRGPQSIGSNECGRRSKEKGQQMATGITDWQQVVLRVLKRDLSRIEPESETAVILQSLLSG